MDKLKAGDLVRFRSDAKLSSCHEYLRGTVGIVEKADDSGYCELQNMPGILWYVETFELVESDNVNHPSHYQMAGGKEVIDFIDAACGKGANEYYRGNILKYVCRYQDKGGVESLKKARWYLDRLISRLNNEANDE